MITLARRFIGCVVTAIAIIALIGISAAVPEDARPSQTTGVTLHASSTLPLGPQIPALEGYALQIRTIVLEQGAVAAYHSHATRPVVAYLVSGDYTEHGDGEGVIVHKQGDQWIEGANVAHWSENRGTEPTYLVNVEVFATK